MTEHPTASDILKLEGLIQGGKLTAEQRKALAYVVGSIAAWRMDDAEKDAPKGDARDYEVEDQRMAAQWRCMAERFDRFMATFEAARAREAAS